MVGKVGLAGAYDALLIDKVVYTLHSSMNRVWECTAIMQSETELRNCRILY